MSIDTFQAAQHDAFTGYEPASADRLFGRLDWLAHHLRVEVVGEERLPPGRALLVANHTFGWDVAFVMSSVRRRAGRQVWALGEHAWWRFPFLRGWAASVGTVDGTMANADALLSHDQLVLVLPGGLREAVKPRELRYRLLWGHRFGFVRAAIRNQAPVVPLAAIGADDFFDFVGNAYRRGERWLRRKGIPIPLPARVLPIPHIVPLKFVIGEPIPPPRDPASAEDPFTLRRFRHEVAGALYELMDAEIARRLGIDLG